MTEAEMARRLGTTKSRISKLESAGIGGIRVSDLVAYATALDKQLVVSLQEKMTAVESVSLDTGVGQDDSK